MRPRSSPRRIGADAVAGTPVGSSAGYATCAVMTVSTPAEIAARNGARSTASSAAASSSTRGVSWCESPVVPPWPGKCLAQHSWPPAWAPSTNAADKRAASSGSRENARVPMMGLRGSRSTSATGPQVTWMPVATASRAAWAAKARTASSASSGGRCPNAASCG